MNILIADDDTISRMALRDSLASHHRLHFQEFPDGESAWDALNRGLAPALCLLDVRMPGLSGIDLLRRIRGDIRFTTLPVMIITSSAQKETIIEAGRLGLDGIVVKPVEGRATAARVLPALQHFLNDLLDPPLKVRQKLSIPEDRYLQYLGSLLSKLESLSQEPDVSQSEAIDLNLKDQLDSLRTSSLTLGARHLARVIGLLVDRFQSGGNRRPQGMPQTLRFATQLLQDYLEYLDIRPGGLRR
jgi:CheY-like chemotaxis protein